jgi:hypothetical protein
MGKVVGMMEKGDDSHPEVEYLDKTCQAVFKIDKVEV